MQFGKLPVFSVPQLAFTDFDRQGLGGFDTLRGYKRERFIGASAVALAAETRWFITEWYFWGQHFKPGLAVFVDAGRASDDVTFSFKR